MSYGMPWDAHKGYTGKYELSGRPVAPQIRNEIKTEIDFRKFLAEAAEGGRYEADEFMRRGDSKWVARAFAEGWSHVLRDIVAELCRRHMLEQGRFPTAEHLSRLTINKEDYESFKAIGRHS
jgi:hypothetical protein